MGRQAQTGCEPEDVKNVRSGQAGLAHSLSAVVCVKHHLIFRLPVVSGEKKNTYEQFRSSHHDGTREHFLMCVVLFVNHDAHRVHNSR